MATTTLSKEKLFAYIVADRIQVEKEVINKAKGNDAESLSKIADIYYDKKTFNKAIDWYRLAAAKNNAHSQWKIGYMYCYGLGVSVDYKLAMEWYLKAHNNGNTQATNSIGHLYDDGYGVYQDYNTALKWHLEAAYKGDKRAQWSVGFYYRTGRGVKVDKQYALEWYEKSAEQGYELAKDDIKRLNEEGFYLRNDQKKSIQMEKIITKQKERIDKLENRLKVVEQQKDKEISLLWQEIKALKLSRRV